MKAELAVYEVFIFQIRKSTYLECLGARRAIINAWLLCRIA